MPIYKGQNVTEQEYYKLKFKENLEKIKENDPTFRYDEKNIDKYITPERIALHKRAKQAIAQLNQSTKETEKLPVPTMFVRNYNSIRDISGTKEAKEKNKITDKLICEHSKQGDEFRKHILVDVSNRIAKLDMNKIDYSIPFEECANYVLDNFALLKTAAEFQRTHEQMVSSGGFDIKPELKDDLKDLQGRGVTLCGLGSSLIEFADSEYFLTFPFEELPVDQLIKLSSKICETAEEKIGFAKMVAYAGPKSDPSVYNKSQYKAVPYVLKDDDFYNVRPNLDTVMDGLYKAIKGLEPHVKDMDEKSHEFQLFNYLTEAAAKLSYEDKSNPSHSKEILSLLENADKQCGYSDKAKYAFLNETRDILARCAGSLFAFESCMKEWGDAEVAKKESSEKELKADEKEALFNKAVELTNEYKNIPEIVEARNELLNYVGRTELDKEKIRPLLASVLYGKTLADKGAPLPNKEEYQSFIDKACESPAFKEMLDNFTPDDLLNTLSEKDAAVGEELLYDKIKEAPKPLHSYSSRKLVIESLMSIRDELSSYTGPKNAPEYTELMTKLNENITLMSGNTVNDEAFSKALKNVSDSAEKYCITKIGQEMNKTRPQRVMAAASIVRLADLYKSGGNVSTYKKDEKEQLLDTIAARIISSKQGKNFSAKNFQNHIKDMRASQYFKELFDTPNVTTDILKKSLKQQPEKLFKLVKEKYMALNKEPMDIKKIAEYAPTHSPNSTLIKAAFYEDWIKSGRTVEEFENNPHGMRHERSGLVSLAMCRMLEKGFSLENIVNENVLKEEKAAAFREIAEMVLTPGAENTKKIAELYALGAKASYEYVSQKFNKCDLNNPCCLMNKDTMLIEAATNFSTDCMQESERGELKNDFINAFGGQEKYKKFEKKEVQLKNIVSLINKGARTAVKLKDGGSADSIALLTDVMVAKVQREQMKSMMKKVKGHTVDEVMDVLKNSSIGNSLAAEVSMDQKLLGSIENNISSVEFRKNIGKKYLSGEFDKSYTIKAKDTSQPTDAMALYEFDIQGFDKAVGKLAPKELSKSSMQLQ